YAALLGLQLYDEQRFEEAEAWLSRVRKNEANFAESRFRLAQILLRRDQNEQARTHLDEALAANPALLQQAKQVPDFAALLSGTRSKRSRSANRRSMQTG
ncbi:MAG: tetratricopeptide repeat protein, partial [Elusimicrobia bacterium]